MNLKKLAQGQPCYLRLTGLCCRNAETVALCHIRRGGLGGTGIKQPDIAAVPMCHVCHGVYDGRIKTEHTRERLDAEMLRALVQWLSWLWSKEIVIAVEAA